MSASGRTRDSGGGGGSGWREVADAGSRASASDHYDGSRADRLPLSLSPAFAGGYNRRGGVFGGGVVSDGVDSLVVGTTNVGNRVGNAHEGNHVRNDVGSDVRVRVRVNDVDSDGGGGGSLGGVDGSGSDGRGRGGRYGEKVVADDPETGGWEEVNTWKFCGLPLEGQSGKSSVREVAGPLHVFSGRNLPGSTGWPPGVSWVISETCDGSFVGVDWPSSVLGILLTVSERS